MQGDIAQQRWELNGDTISFGPGPDYVLINGQNRLRAIANGSVTVMCIVVMGVTQCQSVDSAQSRSLPQRVKFLLKNLSVQTGASAANIAAAANILIRIQNEKMEMTPAHTEAIEYIENNPSLAEYVAACNPIREIVSPGVMGAVMFMSHVLVHKTTKPSKEMTAFIEALRTGSMLSTNSAVRRLREQLIKNHNSSAKFSPKHMLGVIIKAWNCFREGREIQALVFHANEAFPTID